MPKHAPRSYRRNDPSGGGQWRFWALIGLAVVVGIGLVVLWQSVTR